MLHRELLIAGHFIGGPCDQSVGKEVARSPWDGRGVGTVAEGGWTELRTAIAAARDFQPLAREARQGLLRRIAASVRERCEELAFLAVDEIGKPVALARAEVARTAITFELAAEALDDWGYRAVETHDPRAAGRRTGYDWVPRGVILALTPYNWPYNLAAHKIAAALAVGAPMVLKPSPKAALCSLTLARLIHEAGCPPGALNAWNGPAPLVRKALADAAVAMLSFTGSERVGWELRAAVPHLPMTLELGGDASAIVLEDADLDGAIAKAVPGAFAYAGQICISVQHVRVPRRRFAEAFEKLSAAAARVRCGDPADETVLCGPVIDAEAADRIEAWVREAGTVPRREGNLVYPTVVPEPRGTRLATEEAFGPVLCVWPHDGLDDAIAQTNASRFGIHVGIFTNDREAIARAFAQLQIGGLVVNDVPTLRFDALPYGGVKRSGLGREGVRWTMESYCEPRSLVM